MNSMNYTIVKYDCNLIHQKIIDAISLEYKSYNFAQKFAFKLGSSLRGIKNFISTPQASALGLISFWASFIITLLFITMAINTFTAYVIFGLFLVIHTHLTFDAVSALIKESLFNFYKEYYV